MLRLLKNKASDLSDETLLERYRRSKRQEDLLLLFDRYVELLYGLCLKYLKREAEAEDAVMGIYEQLVRKLGEQEIHNFRSWLYVSAKNYCLMQLRRENRRPTDFMAPEIMQSVDGRHHTTRPSWEEDPSPQQLEDCLKQLIREQRECIRLFYFENHSYKEIAAKKRLDLGRVRSHIQNGRRNLRNCMEAKQKAMED